MWPPEEIHLRLRQIALVVRDLELVTRQVTDVLGLEVAYSDPDVGVFGLRAIRQRSGVTFPSDGKRQR